MNLEFLTNIITPEIEAVLKLLGIVILLGHFLFGVLIYRQVIRANSMIKSKGTRFIYFLATIYVIILALIIVMLLIL